ncbi:single-stranded-DNA-specific exonuclease RecJ [Arenimonas terrae]|uniref:Single-stranded-DNA-specific exonuclease RecJ n=1 Tax=Arenimonas terrae TaxID=2546226 RepID=A0A5C4RTA6_9GAMM|nr:single-stranded-DNA-specific exonuclease RecJ [Arenimonas terrae]TNJ34563.1 single-stranded-DNA-specific exonuclease RecJ [Arenimonas terrae]
MTPAPIRIRRREVPAHGPWPDTVSPVLQRIYAARGVTTPDQGELRLARLLPPEALGRVDAATALLAEAIAHDRHILVVGDFDCDGATGTAVAVRGLRLLGARRVGYQVPHRVTHGYGLSPALVEDLVAMAPDLVLTVDSGIACHTGIAAAKARGWQVLVTDHHLPGEQLPPADAIVNPNLAGDPFPSKALAGVGVVFYLLLALRRRLRDAGAFAGAGPDLASLLDLVAVGTVADLVPLDFNNRLLVSAGLRRIRQGQCQPGLRALAELAGKDLATLSAGDIGYGLAPRLNAAGRLEDMALGIECLLCDDPTRARELATVLDRINAERRDMQQQMVDAAEALVAALPPTAGERPVVYCLRDADWHPGVVGLVASKLKERMHRPVLAFAPAEPGSDQLKGSARSIPGLHIRDALAAVDAKHPGLIERFGGHAMAAGLSLAAADFEAFRDALARQVATMLSAEQLQSELLSDGELAPADFGRGLAEQLRLAGPWGQGFPEPVFDGVFTVLQARPLSGGRHLKLSLLPEQGGVPLSAIHFGGGTDAPLPTRIRVAYQLELDDWNGRRGVQLLVRHWQPV